MLTTVVLPFK